MKVMEMIDQPVCLEGIDELILYSLSSSPWSIPKIGFLDRDISAPGDHVSCLSFSSDDPLLTCSCRGCCSQRQRTTTVNKFSGISFYLVCWGISVGGKGIYP